MSDKDFLTQQEELSKEERFKQMFERAKKGVLDHLKQRGGVEHLLEALFFGEFFLLS